MIEGRYSVTGITLTAVEYNLTWEELRSALMSECMFNFENFLDIGFGLLLIKKFYLKEIKEGEDEHYRKVRK